MNRPSPPGAVGGTQLRRRTISISTVVGGLVLTVMFAPILFLAAALVDIGTGRRRWPHVRLLALVILALAIELVGIMGAFGAWLIFGCGKFLHTKSSQNLHFGLQRWWTGALLTVAQRTIGLHIEVEDPTPAAKGNAIVIGRHTSIGDAAIPAVLLGNLLGLDTRYVVKRSLMWSPCIDLVGHRLPHHFVERRMANNQDELATLRAIATGLDDTTSVVIFPEGTFFTPERHARAISRLAQGTRADLASRAEQLRHLLPPRPAGTLALLDGAPRADVVVLGHIGFEQFSSLQAIRKAVPFTEPVRVWVWRIPRSDIPIGDDQRVDWLCDVWQHLDASITERINERPNNTERINE